MSSLIISVSGLRGIIGETLTPQVAMNYVAAYSAFAKPGPFVIARDSRASGSMLADAIRAALAAVGRPVIDAGVAATPTTGVLIRQYQAVGGIQITASHNPSQYNGLKLFNDEGRVIPQVPGEKVKELYHAGVFDLKPYDQLGWYEWIDDPTWAHINAILETVNVEAIRAKKYRVLLDSNRGAGSIMGCKLLGKLGCQLTVLGKEPDGQFEHTPEPTEENLQSVFEKVRQANVDIGFCQDPDADRLAVIDASGRYLGEEYTVAMCLDHVLQTREKGPVVINCASSRMSQDVAEKHGVAIYRSAVGEANVVDLMKAKNAVFGGEGNGGPIDPNVGYVRDSFVGMAQLLDA
ncbi:MAG: phosphoglucosamine mutase, partial [Planctomycetaceae bacterium]|nr:phosphoglucosamine mutase [Planctomycetaceae bacterium]